MTTDELKAAASAILSEYPPSEFVRKFAANAIHRIASLERERDELKFTLTESNIALVNMKAERDEARELIREIAACSDEHCGLNYVTKQIPKSLLSRIGDALKAWKGCE